MLVIAPATTEMPSVEKPQNYTSEPNEGSYDHRKRRVIAAEPTAQYQRGIHAEIEFTAHAVGGDKPQPLSSGGGQSRV